MQPRTWLNGRLLAALTLTLILALPLSAVAGPSVTTGLGYKTMVQELCALYAQKTGQKATEMYSGNIGQMLEQVKAGSGATVVISDKLSLKASDVRFARFQPLGEAVLVLAWRKGITLQSPQDLRGAQVAKIGHPDAKAAIYGRAAVAYLKGSGLMPAVKDKVAMFSTVPQVFSYLVSGDLDAGFVNEAIVRKQGKKIGGWMEIRKDYEPLLLVAGVVQGQEDAPGVRAFMDFLATPEALAVCRKHGLRPEARP
jgi:molybdate transport system substrate-binding protein